jgi:Fe2+ transport system protein FeoA
VHAGCPNLDKGQGNCSGLPGKNGGLPLSVLTTGETGVVIGFNGEAEFSARMMALGMIPGQTVTVVNGGSEQPYLVRVAASRVMLDWQTLNRIYIQPVCECRKRRRKMRWWNA